MVTCAQRMVRWCDGARGGDSLIFTDFAVLCCAVLLSAVCVCVCPLQSTLPREGLRGSRVVSRAPPSALVGALHAKLFLSVVDRSPILPRRSGRFWRSRVGVVYSIQYTYSISCYGTVLSLSCWPLWYHSPVQSTR